MEVSERTLALEKNTKKKRKEKSANYTYTKKIWHRNEIVVDNVFVFTVATEIINDFEPKTVDE